MVTNDTTINYLSSLTVTPVPLLSLLKNWNGQKTLIYKFLHSENMINQFGSSLVEQ